MCRSSRSQTTEAGTVSEGSWSSGPRRSRPPLFPSSNWAELWLECKCWRIALTRGDADEEGEGVRGLLATSLGLIGGFWPEKGGTSVAVAVPRLSMWQPHWWDQLFWVQRTVITSSPSVGGVSPPPTYPPLPLLVRWLRVLSSFQTHLNLASVDVCASPGDFIHRYTLSNAATSPLC